MFRSFLILAATWGVCLTAMLPALPATAADKGKWWQSAKSGSSNGSDQGSSNGSANGFSTPNLRGKVSKMPQEIGNSSASSSSNSPGKFLPGLNGLGGNTSGSMNGLNANGLKLGKQQTGPLKFNPPIDFGGIQKGGGHNGVPLNGPGAGNFGNARQPLPAFDPNQKISETLKNAKIRPITDFSGLGALGGGNGAPGNGAGGANGGGRNGSLPPAWIQDHLDQFGGGGNLADAIRDGVVIDGNRFNPDFIGGGAGNGPQQDNSPPGGNNVPPGDNGNNIPPGGAPNPGPGGNGQADPDPNGGDLNGGNPGGGGPGDADPGDGNPGPGDPVDPHDDDCHDHPFPWWPPIIIGGGGGHNHCPPSANITVIEQPLMVLPQVQNVPATVDLQLLDVRLVDAGDPARNLGPRYRLVFGNAGTVAAGNFRVLAMASRDGAPDPAASAAAAEVISLAAGKVAMADVRLPLVAELPSMGALIVVVDSAMQIAETDEENNVAVLDRAAIAAVDLTTAATP